MFTGETPGAVGAAIGPHLITNVKPPSYGARVHQSIRQAEITGRWGYRRLDRWPEPRGGQCERAPSEADCVTKRFYLLALRSPYAGATSD
jgi:hypothetical protein